MKIRQIRNATLRIDYAGTRFLIDPYLANKDAYPGFEGTVNSHIRNPRVELKTPLEEIFAVDAVIVTRAKRPRVCQSGVRDFSIPPSSA